MLGKKFRLKDPNVLLLPRIVITADRDDNGCYKCSTPSADHNLNIAVSEKILHGLYEEEKDA